jgi:glycerophosphoryl diester phosphodiesterase
MYSLARNGGHVYMHQAPTFGRRTFLAAVSAGALGLAAGSLWRRKDDSTMTVERWVRARGVAYVVGHRGSGDVLPEHTMQAYEGAYGWGARAMEVSTSSTSDGVLICMHDLTYDRTTTITGAINDLPSSVLRTARVRQPQLGPFWATPPLPRIPLLDDVLTRFGGRMVLCIEPKRDADYAAVAAAIHRRGLSDSVVMKLYHTSSRIDVAKHAGFPLFVYFGTDDVSASAIRATAARLDAARDYLVLPTSSADGQEYLPDGLVRAAVDSRVPTWVYPVHRRSEADHYRRLGAVGIVSSSVGYSMSRVRPEKADQWSAGKIAVGEMTLDPASPGLAPTLHAGGVLALDAASAQHFLTVGQFCPIATATGNYRIEFEARWDELPTDRTRSMSLAFAQSDDRYYEEGLGRSDGYHAVHTAEGSLELYRHAAGSATGIPLGSHVATAAPQRGRWMRFRLDVTPTSLTWRRTDGTQPAYVSVNDSHVRGGYSHIGRTSADGSLSFRRFTVG